MSSQNPVMRVFSFIWRLLERLVKVIQILVFLLVIGFLVAVFSGMQGVAVRVPASAALIIEPSGVLVDQLAGEPLELALSSAGDQSAGQTLVRDVVRSLRVAAADDRIKAVVLKPDAMQGGGLSKQQAIAQALLEFRASGKPVISMADSYSQAQYYLAAHADMVFMHGLGTVLFEGFGYYKAYFADAIDKLKVDINIFRVGEYKSFVEPFQRNDMSDEDRESTSRWLGALWSTWLDEVAAARNVDRDQLVSYAENYLAFLAGQQGDTFKAAQSARLVDEKMDHASFRRYMIEKVGPADGKGDDFASIDYQSYLSAVDFEQSRGRKKPDNVAVIVAAGEIVDGEASPGTVGSTSLTRLIRQAGSDKTVKAVVLQVDSPGGSMFASEVVLAELNALRQSGKPLVVSMSSVAASGGYYIALAADEIWATETTVSGSIGVGAVFPTFQRSLDALGVNIDGFGTTELAGQFSGLQSLNDTTRSILDLTVSAAYTFFLDRVAEARDMDVTRVDELARGQIWLGSDALELGLVNKIGTVDDAARSAAKLAGLLDDDWNVIYIERKRSLAEQLLLEYMRLLGIRALSGHEGIAAVALGLLPQLKSVNLPLMQWNDPRGLYFHCLCVAL